MNETRKNIIDVGRAFFAKEGFTAVGLSQILKAANVPKGSFYHYFGSKEKFAEEVINDYFNEYFEVLTALLNNSGKSGLDSLLDYFNLWIETQSNPESESKCLVVKLSAEVADLSFHMRNALQSGTDEIINRLTGCIQKGIDDGSIKDVTPAISAELIYNMWLGASLMSKLREKDEPMNLALKFTIAHLSK